MTRLGKSSPLARVTTAIQGWLHPPRPKGTTGRRTAVIGHRGAARFRPENTVSSFVKAIELGADGIETDICVTRDGCFVLWHDADPNDKVPIVRQLGWEGLLFRPDAPALGSSWRRPVRALDLVELQRHYRYVRAQGPQGDGDDPGDRGATAPIEVFDDLIGWAQAEPRVKHVCLDLKLEADQGAAVVSLLALLRRLSAQKTLRDITVHLLSPQAEIVAALVADARREKLPDSIRISADFELPGAAELAPSTGAEDVSLGAGERIWAGFRLDVGKTVRARDAGTFGSVVTWTINDRERLAELVRLNVDGVITDEPALLRELVGGR